MVEPDVAGQFGHSDGPGRLEDVAEDSKARRVTERPAPRQHVVWDRAGNSGACTLQALWWGSHRIVGAATSQNEGEVQPLRLAVGVGWLFWERL